MSTPAEALILDLVEWVARSPRPYAEAIDAWRTSCPKLTIWEDAMDRGLVACQGRADGSLWVVATAAGRETLVAARGASAGAGA